MSAEDEINAMLEGAQEQGAENVAEEAVPAVEEVDNNDFFGDDDDDFVLPDPSRVITVMTSSGNKAYVNTEEAITVSEVILRSGLNIMVGAEYFLNGAQIPADEMVPAGQTLQVVGTVKGG